MPADPLFLLYPRGAASDVTTALADTPSGRYAEVRGADATKWSQIPLKKGL